MAFRAAAGGAPDDLEIVDLTATSDSPPASVARAAAAAVARHPKQDGIVLLDDSSDENTPNRTMAHSPGRAGRFKTDPNERHHTAAAAAAKYSSPRKRQRTNDDAAIQVAGLKPAPVPPEAQVLEWFPEADLNHVKQLLAQHDNNPQVVIPMLAEKPSYPRSSDLKRPPPTGGGVTIQLNDGYKWQYDFMSTESFQPSKLYISQAEQHILWSFPCITKAGAARLLKGCKCHYAVCHEKICNAIKGTNQDALELQFQRLIKATCPWQNLTQQEFRRLGAENGPIAGCVLKKKRKPAAGGTILTTQEPPVTDPILREEIRFVKVKLDEWKKTAKLHYDREQNKLQAEHDGTGIECPCCCDSFPVGDMVACRNEGHLFCCDCLEQYAKNQIFGLGSLGPADPDTKKPATELLCFHGEGCRSGFDRACLEKALPPATLQKYDALQFQISIDSAGLEDDIATCPKCGYKAVMPQSQRIFECPVADCRFESCRECGEAAHIPLRCEEVEKESETKGRLTVEEAISAAKIRRCPKCNKPFIRSEGCNKITCGCGAKSCYICRAMIKDYSHFCQTPHCTHKKCRKCPLWTKDEEMDLQAMRRAGVEAASQVQREQRQQAQQQQGGGGGSDKNDKKKKGRGDVRIDVDGYLRPTR